MPRPLPVHGEAEAASETPETLLALREAGSLTGNRKGPGRPQRRRNDSLATVARGGGEQVREVYGEQAYEKRKRALERASQPLVPSRFP